MDIIWDSEDIKEKYHNPLHNPIHLLIFRTHLDNSGEGILNPNPSQGVQIVFVVKYSTKHPILVKYV